MDRENVYLGNIKYSVSELQKLLTEYEQKGDVDTLKEIKITMVMALEEIRNLELLSEFKSFVSVENKELKGKLDQITDALDNLGNLEVEMPNSSVTAEPKIEETQEKIPDSVPEHQVKQSNTQAEPQETKNSEILTDQETTNQSNSGYVQQENTKNELNERYKTNVENENTVNTKVKKDLVFDVNDRIYFQRELFNNDPYHFHISMKKIQEKNSIQEVLDLINNDLSEQYNWNMDDESTQRFVNSVEKKLV